MANQTQDLDQLWEQLEKRSPATQWEIVVVTFTSADADQDIITGLRPKDPEAIDYRVLRASGPPVVYHDTSATRTKWTSGVVRLRSAIAGLKVHILLEMSADTSRTLLDGGSKTFGRGLLPAEIAYEDEVNTFTQSGNTFTDEIILSGAADPLKVTGAGTSGDPDLLLRAKGSIILQADYDNDGTEEFLFRNGAGTDVAKLDESGNVTLFGGQIAFPAAQSASAGANTLDDYEEGTWTPVIGGAGGTSGQTYGTQLGRYVKVGKHVFVQAYIVLSNKGTITGAVQVQGLPFTTLNLTNFFGSLGLEWFGWTTAFVFMRAEVNPNATTATIYTATGAATGLVSIVTGDLNNTSQLVITGSYVADA